MSTEFCCTCAAILSPSPDDEKSEKQNRYERRLECCNRLVCTRCINKNPRFATYCPWCQVSIVPSSLPQGLRDPPAYSPPAQGLHSTLDGQPPPYSVHNPSVTPPEKSSKDGEPAQDVLHFVDQNKDTITSLSLSYGVPAEVLRRTNGLFADHLLAARRTLLIPAEYYKGGVSLSPRPLEGEEEEIRKGKVRKFMVGCKVAEYDVALLYLQQADYDLDQAMNTFKEDERWEKEHPLDVERSGKRKGKGKLQSSLRRRFLS